jgi:uroporphyrinogen-III decarboxylase
MRRTWAATLSDLDSFVPLAEARARAGANQLLLGNLTPVIYHAETAPA